MKVCVIIDAWEPIWGGGQTHVKEVCLRLVRNYGVDIHIFTRALLDNRGNRYEDSKSSYQHILKITRVEPLARFQHLYARLFWIITVIPHVIREHNKNKFDLIHAHAYLGGIPAIFLSKILKIPCIFTVHGCNNLDLRPRSIPGMIEKFLLLQIPYTYIITVSRNFLKYTHKKNISIIPNGVTTLEKIPMRKRKSASGRFSLLFVGRLEPVKGIDILLKSMIVLAKKIHKVRLLLVGNGSLKQEIIKKIKKYHIQHHVFLLGELTGKKLNRLYKSADVFVLPSLSEGQPITILEALATGLPVVVTNVGDNHLIVKHNVNGYLIPPNDINATINALVRLYSSPYIRKMGVNGYNLVKTNYGWEGVVKKTFLVYKKVLDH